MQNTTKKSIHRGEVLDIVDRAIESGEELTSCQKKNCKREKQKYDREVVPHIQTESIRLVDAAIKKEIDTKEFQKRQRSMLRKAIVHSEVTGRCIQCTLDKCGPEARDKLHQTIVRPLSHDCQTERKRHACSKLKQADAILSQPNMSVKDVHTLRSLMYTSAYNPL